MGSSPIIIDVASGFDSSWLSINTGTADFPHYKFSKLDIPLEATKVVIVNFVCNISQGTGM